MDILKDFEKLPDDAIVPCHPAKPLIGNPSNTTFWRRIQTGVYPKPFKLPGSNINNYTAGTIRQIQASVARKTAA